MPHGPSCTLQTGPFQFEDNFAGDGPLASRVAVPGPGAWAGSATGSTLGGQLGDPLGVTAMGGSIGTHTFSTFLEIGFTLVSAPALGPGVNYMTFGTGSGFIVGTWQEGANGLNVSFPFSELATAGPGWDTAAFVGKEVMFHMIGGPVTSGVNGRVAVCDNDLQSFFGNSWGGSINSTVNINFHGGVVIDHLYAKWA